MSPTERREEDGDAGAILNSPVAVWPPEHQREAGRGRRTPHQQPGKGRQSPPEEGKRVTWSLGRRLASWEGTAGPAEGRSQTAAGGLPGGAGGTAPPATVHEPLCH